MKNSILLLAVVSAAVLSLNCALNCRADDASENLQMHGSCRHDVKKLCHGIQPGDGRIANCLHSHESQLSPECKSAGEHIKDRFQANVKKHKAEVGAPAPAPKQ